MGIIIADGGRGETPTRFSAFVWGPVPDTLEPEPVLVAPAAVADLVGAA